jgi:hypothetical protein
MRPYCKNGYTTRATVPKTGVLISGKNGLPFLGGTTGRSMSLFRRFLFPEKMVCRFWGVQPGAACPFLGVSYFRKKWVAVFGGCNRAQHVPF